jgi:metallo-beta-lactamase class B
VDDESARRGKTYNVVIIGSPNVNDGYKLVGNKLYPRIAEDFENTFCVLNHCLVTTSWALTVITLIWRRNMLWMRAGVATSFIDPEGYKNYVVEREQAFRTELARQKSRGL